MISSIICEVEGDNKRARHWVGVTEERCEDFK